MLAEFRGKTQAMFKIVATVLIESAEEDAANEKTSNFIYQRLLAKFDKQ